MTLKILYQDADLIAIDKPPGMPTHRSPLDPPGLAVAVQTLRDQIGQHVFPVHRLDRGTSGVLLFGLHAEATRHLAQQFQEHRVTKRYLAVVRGHSAETGTIDHPIVPEDNDHGKPAQEAITHFRRLAIHTLPVCIEGYPTSRYSLVEARPCHGRRHQIRRHMKHISHPIIGDATHGRGRHNRYFAHHLACPRLLLACWTVTLDHPMHHERLTLHAPLSGCFQTLVDHWNWRGAINAALSN